MEINAEAFHAAARRLARQAYTADMDAIADAVASFLHTSNFGDEYGVPFTPDGASLGYGVMVGWLANDATAIHLADNERRYLCRILSRLGNQYDDPELVALFAKLGGEG